MQKHLLLLTVFLFSINCWAIESEEFTKIYNDLQKKNHSYLYLFKEANEAIEAGKIKDAENGRSEFCKLKDSVGGINGDACDYLVEAIKKRNEILVIQQAENEKIMAKKAAEIEAAIKARPPCLCEKDIEDRYDLQLLKKSAPNNGITLSYLLANDSKVDDVSVPSLNKAIKACGCWVENNPHLKKAIVVLDKLVTEREESDKKIKADEEKAKQRAIDNEKERAALAKKDQDAEELRERKNNSKECIIAKSKAKYCSNLSNAKSMDLLIANEKRLGKASGYEDPIKLRNLTRSKLMLEDQSEEVKKVYTTAGGKDPLNATVCKIVAVNSFQARYDADFYNPAVAACGGELD